MVPWAGRVEGPLLVFFEYHDLGTPYNILGTIVGA